MGYRQYGAPEVFQPALKPLPFGVGEAPVAGQVGQQIGQGRVEAFAGGAVEVSRDTGESLWAVMGSPCWRTVHLPVCGRLISLRGC